MKLRSFFLPSFLAISFIFSEPCSSSEPSSTSSKTIETAPLEPVFSVLAVYPKVQEEPRLVTSQGTFFASNHLTLKSEVPGTLEKINIAEGDPVQAGDLLATLKNESLRLELEKKQAALKEAEALLEINQKRIDQISKPKDIVFLDEEAQEKPIPTEEALLPPEITPKKEDLAAQVRLDEAKIELLTKELEELDLKLKKLTVQSPIPGIVVKRFTTEGAMVNQGDSLFEIVTSNPVTLSVSVPQDVSSYVDKQAKVKISLFGVPEISHDGEIFFISPTLDPVKKTLELRIHVQNEEGRIKEGQEGKAMIATRKIDKVFVVPKRVLLSEGDKTFVFVASGKRALKTQVEILPSLDPSLALVKANLRIDDPLISSHQSELKDGSAINVRYEPTPPIVAEEKIVPPRETRTEP